MSVTKADDDITAVYNYSVIKADLFCDLTANVLVVSVGSNPAGIFTVSA